MNAAKPLALGALALGLAVAAHAAGDAKQEHSPAPAAERQQEERTGAHSQPYAPGTSATSASKDDRSDASVSGNKDQRFKALDLDGDGYISKAEAAGHADVVTGFDRADRNNDGKLSRAEFERLGQQPPARTAGKPRGQPGASAGASGR
jgi:hypothetical protein